MTTDEYGLGPVQRIERDPVLERAVTLVQQAFPGTIEIEQPGGWGDSSPPREEPTPSAAISGTPPAGQGSVKTAPQADAQPAPAHPSEETPERAAFLAALKQLIDEAFGKDAGANRGAAIPWLKLRMKTLGKTRIQDLTFQDLHQMCDELEDKIETRRAARKN